mmetsp:Transcript_21610/g.59938  ORF Transcript_21610/g.59938 Transcript_21610/m.59938 type:complete len:100 (-) Transcript_21610:657-956(-)
MSLQTDKVVFHGLANCSSSNQLKSHTNANKRHQCISLSRFLQVLLSQTEQTTYVHTRATCSSQACSHTKEGTSPYVSRGLHPLLLSFSQCAPTQLKHWN